MAEFYGFNQDIPGNATGGNGAAPSTLPKHDRTVCRQCDNEATIVSQQQEIERLRAALGRLRCEGCGNAPNDHDWRWCEPVEGYMNAHIVGDDYCGPVTFRAVLGTTEGAE